MVAISDKLKFIEQPADAKPETLVDIYEGVARNHPKPDTLNYKRDGAWHSMSAVEMLRHSRWIALGLYSLGIRKGDRIALLSESRVEWVLADQGCIFAGAVGVPIYPTLTPPQVAYIVKDSGARALFVSTPAKLAEIEVALSECGDVENVVVFDADSSGYAGIPAGCVEYARSEARWKRAYPNASASKTTTFSTFPHSRKAISISANFAGVETNNARAPLSLRMYAACGGVSVG